MNSSSIDRPSAPATRRRAKGTAEVELLLVLPVLLTILLLCAVAARLGHARLSNVRDAEQAAYQQALRGTNISASAALVPASSMDTVRPTPSLPTRFDEATPSVSPTIEQGWIKLNGVTLADKAAFLDPTWHFANWPMEIDSSTGLSRDTGDVKDWFLGYIDEAHPWELRYALGLADPWKP